MFYRGRNSNQAYLTAMFCEHQTCTISRARVLRRLSPHLLVKQLIHRIVEFLTGKGGFLVPRLIPLREKGRVT